MGLLNLSVMSSNGWWVCEVTVGDLGEPSEPHTRLLSDPIGARCETLQSAQANLSAFYPPSFYILAKMQISH